VTKSKCSRHAIDCASKRIRLLSKIRFRLGYLLRQSWLADNICPINGKVLLKWPHFHELRDARILQKVTSFRSWKSLKLPGLSRPREFHPRPLRKPDVNLSVHPALAMQQSIVGITTKWNPRNLTFYPCIKRVVQEQIRQ